MALFLAALILNLPLVHSATVDCAGRVAITPACSCCGGDSSCCVAPKAFPEKEVPQALFESLTLTQALSETAGVVAVRFAKQRPGFSPSADPVRGPPLFLKHVRLLI
ncbi:MAG: hypothetical protein WEB60_11245 [Terrimicrobiaceae bacterium]